MATSTKAEWRELILRHVWEEHELSPDELHVGADDEKEDLQNAEGAVAELVAEGVLHEAPDGLITCAVGAQGRLELLVHPEGAVRPPRGRRPTP